MIPCEWIKAAEKRISGYIHQTPFTYDQDLKTYLKWENQQETGSFKIRGAMNKILSLEPWEREAGLVAASAGNHGAGVAFAARETHSKAIIFVSSTAVRSKIDLIRDLGAEVRVVEGGYGEAEKAGIEYASSINASWISPYNDGQIIAGQATLGMEILQEIPEPENTTWVVPVGGGGLMAGIACAIECTFRSSRTTNPKEREKYIKKPRLIAVQSEASPFFHEIYHRGSQEGVIELESIADGLAGRIEQNSTTIPILRRFVDDFILVSEKEIIESIVFSWERYKQRIEGSAAVAIAAILGNKIQDGSAVAIITGGNIQPEVHKNLYSQKG